MTETEIFHVKKEKIAEFLDIPIEEVPESYEEYTGKYEIRAWTFGERERIIGDSSEQIVTDDGKVKSRLDSSLFRLNVMQNCIIDTPLKTKPSKQYLIKLPIWLGEALWAKVNELNETMTNTEAKKFEFS